MADTSTDVLVVGAGPTGLMLAAWLARLGVDAVLVDDGEGPTQESRAVVVQARSMELYAQLGMVDAVRDRVTWARRLRPGWEDRPALGGALPVADMMRGLTPYPGVHVLEQSANERLLGARLRELGGQVTWRHRLTDLHHDADGVTAELDTPTGRRRLTARWVVGADGARSAVRGRAGVAFPGRTHEQTFWVADAHGVDGLVDATITVRGGRDRFLLTFPLGPDHHRLIGVAEGEDVDLGRTRQQVAERFGITMPEPTWFATYRLHHRVADRFRAGRALLAGDAAHVHSPVGGQGMNTGLQDAHNLALALGDVLAGHADDVRLDRYQAERRPVAERLVGTTDRLFATVVDPSPRAVAARRVVFPVLAPLLATVVPRLPLSGRMAGYVGQLRIHYWMTPDAEREAGGRRGRVVGRRLPWTGANHDVLRAGGWQVHAYGPTLPQLPGLPSLVRVGHRFDPRPDLGLDAGRWLLVRPDGFVAAAAEPGRAASVFTDVLRAQGYRDAALRPHPAP
uniref:FAD-dependent monooxygenase n=1 Tax=Desertihabitans aurantiacus TaxID=2282477 RepID=UPI000DF7ED60